MTEEEKMKWSTSQALTRPFSIDDMRRFLRSAGDDKERAEKWLVNLDQLLVDGYRPTALKFITTIMIAETEFVSSTDSTMLN